MAKTREEAFVQAISDDDCQKILQSIREEAKTVSTLSEECGIPLSTTYRKVNCLKQASLIEEQNRIRRSHKPENVYSQSFEGAVITIGDDGNFEVAFLEGETEDSMSVLCDSPVNLRVGSD